MTDIFKRVKRGEPLAIPAAAYNAMLDAAQTHQNRNIRLAPMNAGFDSLYVHIVNKTGRQLERFDVVGIDSPSERENFDAFCNRICFDGVVPQKQHKGKFAVLQQDAAPDMVVRVCIYGASVAKVLSRDAVKEIRYCDIVEGETSFFVSGGQTEVLWRDASSYWAIIRIGSGRSTLFPATLKRCGGEQGTDKKVASWKYDVVDALTDETLEENVDPTSSPHQWKRPNVGALLEATFGYAHYDKDGKLVLGWINEIAEQESCTT
ncbi:MAG: hypothetical protein LBT05_14915 [Planctomycetaceae bacterium]|jgi:hypothetical protein|nr:hypothetical protein [Planctomycetaceae bacterium]